MADHSAVDSTADPSREPGRRSPAAGRRRRAGRARALVDRVLAAGDRLVELVVAPRPHPVPVRTDRPFRR
ncbi:MAG: hypothetical protein ACFCVK_17375 [Acidimicrobiales bacterium]